jgi:EmrB/QacA subfamily drug resistance transporter
MTGDVAAAPVEAVEANDRARWIALYVLCIGMLMIVLDGTIVNVALPVIQEDLGFSQSSLAWIVNAYLIAFGGLLLLAGRFGDLLGRRSVFLCGLVVFTVASVLCGAATTQEMLVGARFLQGVGGAMTSAVILGMIVTMFPGERERAQAIGVYSFTASAGGSVGLLLGGVLTQSINWHWIFFVNLPIGIVTFFVAQKLLPRDTGIGYSEGADIPGAALITSALMLGVYTIVKPAADLGWTDSRTLLLGAIALALLVGFIVREYTAAKPLMPLRIFRSRNTAGANLVQALFVAGMFGMFFLGSLYMEGVLHYDALHIGLAFIPITLIIGVLSLRYSELLLMRFGPKKTLLPGLGLSALALAYLARVPTDGHYWQDMFPVMALLGIGAGISFPGMMLFAMSDTEDRDAGLASGLVNTTLQVGGAIGLAVLATLSASRTAHLGGSRSVHALMAGYHLAFWLSFGFIVFGLLVAVLVLRTPRGPVRRGHGH